MILMCNVGWDYGLSSGFGEGRVIEVWGLLGENSGLL